MNIEVEDFIDVEEKTAALGLSCPTGIALIPRNLAHATNASELRHEKSVLTLRKLLRQAGISEDVVETNGPKIPLIHENAFELLLPTLFVGAMAISSNPAVVSIALNVIGNYATDFFRGIVTEKRVSFSVVLKDKNAGKYKGSMPFLVEIREQPMSSRHLRSEVQVVL